MIFRRSDDFARIARSSEVFRINCKTTKFSETIDEMFFGYLLQQGFNKKEEAVSKVKNHCKVVKT